MAHPFSAVPTAYPVKSEGRTYWANCAWDALGIPAMLHKDSKTETYCADCKTPLTIVIENDEVTSSQGIIHFAVPPRHFWDNVGFT